MARSFPFSPKTTARLELGDVIAIDCGDGTWAALQVSHLTRSGPGARTGLGVGTLPWRGAVYPTPEDLAGLSFLEHGRTTIQIFTEGGALVVAEAPLAGGPPSTLDEHGVGTVHGVWGWRTAFERAKAALEAS